MVGREPLKVIAVVSALVGLGVGLAIGWLVVSRKWGLIRRKRLKKRQKLWREMQQRRG